MPSTKRISRAHAALQVITANATDICDFMARLNRCVPEGNRRKMVSTLANLRRLAETIPGGIAPPTVCQALEREGILIRTHVRKRSEPQYALAPSWSRMFDRLLDRNDAPPAFLN